MRNLNAIIAEEEEFARSKFTLLQKNFEFVQVTGTAKSVQEALILLEEHDIDLIFLDIAMPGEDGFKLL